MDRSLLCQTLNGIRMLKIILNFVEIATWDSFEAFSFISLNLFWNFFISTKILETEAPTELPAVSLTGPLGCLDMRNSSTARSDLSTILVNHRIKYGRKIIWATLANKLTQQTTCLYWTNDIWLFPMLYENEISVYISIFGVQFYWQSVLTKW